MNELKITNRLLFIIALPIVFFMLKTLNFIFIPLFFSMFLALLFLPLMRWLVKRGVPKPISILLVIGIIVVVLRIGGELIHLSANEIIDADSLFFEKAETKIESLIKYIEAFFGIERIDKGSGLLHYIKNSNLAKNFSGIFNYIGDTLTMTLMTIFFIILLLYESINFEKILNTLIFKNKYLSVKTFLRIEKDIVKFVWVKFFVSLFTGIGFSLACLYFGVSFPIFWGLFAFAINFVQMIGSIVSVVLLSIFAFVELETTSHLLFFMASIAGVQFLFGTILEPIFMGKTFSINVITVIVMLMFWGFIWGVPGLIMSIPITVVLKIMLEQFPKTKVIASLMDGK